MKKNYLSNPVSFLFMLIVYSQANAQSLAPTSANGSAIASANANWTIKNPFRSEVFIKNNGQFSGTNLPGGFTNLPAGNAEYAVINSGMNLFFTPSGLSYQLSNVELKPEYLNEREEIFEKMEEQIHKKGKVDDGLKKYFMDKSACVNMEWEGADPNARIEVSERVPDHYSYSVKNEKGEYASVLANAFKKLVYKNIYPHIDIEYYFPMNIDPANPKWGVEYNVVVHPGGDLSLVKMKYSGMKNISMDGQGNIVAAIPDGAITDHSPAFSFVGVESNEVQAKFILNGQTVSFEVPQYDKTQKLVIDPFTSLWSVSPGFTTANDGYTIRTDYGHNVFVMGGGVNMGGFPFARWDYQIKKFNPSGVLQWTAVTQAPTAGLYGDMAVLPSGKAIVGHAFGSAGVVYLLDPATGAITNKNTAPGNEPGWRIIYNQALNDNVVWMGGGSNNGAHLYKTDTNITAISVHNPWTAAGNTEDVCYLAQDKTSSFLYVTNSTNSSPNSSTTAPKFVKASTAAPGTPLWKVNEPTNMREAGQGSYMNGGTASFIGGWATGVNGMVVCEDRVYTYNGNDLRAYDPANGTIVNSVTVGGTLDKYSGIDVDNCCRVYVGVNGVIKRYSSALVFDTVIATTGNVFDLKIDPLNDTIIYVTGKGFVQAIGMAACAVTGLPPDAIFTSSDTAFCFESGYCIDFYDHSTNNPTSWSWHFPGAAQDTSTLQNPTGICYYIPGSYAVTLTVTNSSGTDSMKVNPLIIFGSGAALPVITRSGDTLFCSHEAAYQWYFNGLPIPGATDSFYVATQDGSYNVYITDDIGCSRLGVPVQFTDVALLGKEQTFEVYPNPAGNQVIVVLTSLREGDSQINLYNVLGESVYQPLTVRSSQTNMIIDVSHLPKGAYVVELTSESRTYRARVMKE